MSAALLLSGTVLGAPSSSAVDGGHLQGHVTSSRGTPASVWVVAYRQTATGSWHLEGESHADSVGWYDIGGLPPGRYRVEFQGAPDYIGEYYDDAATRAQGADLELAQDEVRAGVDASLTPERPSISGTVTDASGEPLAGIEVTAHEGGGFVRATVETSQDGTYLLSDLFPDSAYRLRFRDPTRLHFDEFFDDRPTLATADPITLTRGQDLVGRDAVLEEAARIAGTVTGPDSLPATGAPVQALRRGEDGDYSVMSGTTTGADGTYELRGLRTGVYRVAFGHTGERYLPEFWDDRSSLEDGADISVTSGILTEGIDARLDTPGVITGRVLDSSGNPLAGIIVRAGAANDSFGATTASDGTYTVSGLVPGRYYVAFESAGRFRPEYWQGARTRSAADYVTVTPSATLALDDTTLEAASTIRGRVTAQGQPLGDVRVVVHEYRNGWWQERDDPSLTDSNGRYVVPGLEPGSYRLSFQDPDFQRPPVFWGGASTLRKAANIRVPTSTEVMGKDVVLNSGATVAGTVTDRGGAPLPGVLVTAYEVVEGDLVAARSTETDSAGAYRLPGLRPGRHRLLFDPDDDDHVSTAWGGADLDSASTLALVEGQVVNGADAVLPRASHITGAVTDGTGAPISHVSIFIYLLTDDGWDFFRSLYADDAGRYSVDGLRAGVYRVGFRDDTHVSEWWDDAPSLREATDIQVGVATTVAHRDATLAGRGTISGRVTGPGGAGLPGILVTASSVDTGRGALGVTDGSGRYVVPSLDRGTFRLRFSDPEGSYLEEFWDDANTSEGATLVHVAAGQAVTGKDATLSTAGHITGQVTGAGGAPIGEGEVDLYRLSSDQVWTTLEWNSADGDGHYVFDGLPTGTYRLSFNFSGYARQVYGDAPDVDRGHDVTVEAGTTVSGVDVALSRARSRVSGTVTDTAGHPLQDVYVTAYRQFQDGFGRAASVSTRSDGTYDVEGLRAGTYRLRFSPATPHVEEFWADRPTLETASDIVVGEGVSVTDRDAVLADAAGVSGTVTDSEGAALPGIEVVAYTVSETDYQLTSFAYTDPEGAYRMSLPSGSYRIGFFDPDGVHTLGFWGGGSSVGTATPVEVGTELVTGVDAVLGPGASVSGTLSGPHGESARGAEVEVYRLETGEFSAFTQVGVRRTGAYVVEGLPAGTYRLRFLDQDGPYVDEWYDDATTLADAADVVVGVGGSATDRDAILAAGSVVNAARPSVSGTPRMGEVLTARPGTWEPTDVAISYQWLRDGSAITGATRPTYTLGVHDVGRRLAVRVTADRGRWEAGVSTSAPTAVVAPATLVNKTLPKVIGRARVGRTLTVTPGAWAPTDVVLRYQWRADGRVVPRATRRTFMLTRAQQGTRLTVRVTAAASGYVTRTVTSRPSAKVPGHRRSITRELAPTLW